MLNLARVVDIHPESHAVDVVLMDDGRRISGVQVLAGSAGTNFGVADLAMPDAVGYEAKNSKTRDIYAVLSWVRDIPVVLGFLYPQVAQCLFREKERMVYRHASDVYVTIDGNGNTEIYHPSGAYFRIGESGAHEDLTGKDYDKVWAIKRNTDKKVHIHLEQGGGVAALDIDPAGNISLTHAGNLTTSTGGNLSATVGGSTDLNSGPVTITAPSLTINAETTINGNVSVNGGVTSSGDMVAGGISGMGHTHTEQGDGAETSGPH